MTASLEPYVYEHGLGLLTTDPTTIRGCALDTEPTTYALAVSGTLGSKSIAPDFRRRRYRVTA